MIPFELCEKEICTGCRLCEDICQTHSISMQYADYFLYPVINYNSCINCKLCQIKCPANIATPASQPYKTYTLRINDRHVLADSSSGGAFTAICKSFYSMYKDGTVFGVKWGDNFNVEYSCAYSFNEIDQFRKSKYIQADTKACYKKVKELLSTGRAVLFFATPCVIAALKSYLNVVDNKRLYTVDLICHGVPSQLLFDLYRKQLEKKNGFLFRFRFRFKNKKKLGFIHDSTTAYMEIGKKKKIVSIYNDPFLRAYYDRIFYRISCYHCKYANITRVGDITIGDAWHIDKLYPDLDANIGVSCILINTIQGDVLMSRIKDCDIRDIPLEFIINNNEALAAPTQLKDDRIRFFEILKKTNNFEKAAFNAIYRPFYKRWAYQLLGYKGKALLKRITRM